MNICHLASIVQMVLFCTVHTQLSYALNANVFLDSANLTDLRKLFKEGLRQSDVVVLLLTKEYLTRPW